MGNLDSFYIGLLPIIGMVLSFVGVFYTQRMADRRQARQLKHADLMKRHEVRVEKFEKLYDAYISLDKETVLLYKNIVEVSKSTTNHNEIIRKPEALESKNRIVVEMLIGAYFDDFLGEFDELMQQRSELLMYCYPNDYFEGFLLEPILELGSQYEVKSEIFKNRLLSIPKSL